MLNKPAVFVVLDFRFSDSLQRFSVVVAVLVKAVMMVLVDDTQTTAALWGSNRPNNKLRVAVFQI